jgi:hypothetical protein
MILEYRSLEHFKSPETLNRVALDLIISRQKPFGNARGIEIRGWFIKMSALMRIIIDLLSRYNRIDKKREETKRET